MQASVLLFRWGSYCWACNLLVLIIYLFFLPVMLPSVLPRLATDSAARVFPGVWKPLLRFPSRGGVPSLPPLSPFLSFIFFPTCIWRQWSAFLGAWCFLPAFRRFFFFNGIYSALKCSFNEFVSEKVVSPSYCSANLGPPREIFKTQIIMMVWSLT